MDILRTGINIPVDADATLHITFGTLLLVLFSHAIVIPVNKFQGPRWYGFYLLTIFAIYTTFNIVAEITELFD